MNFQIASQIVIASIAATSVMTLLSYIISASARELYKEPVLLSYIFSSFKIEASSQTKIILGWLLHYLIGVAFVVIYHFLWIYNIVEMNWITSVFLGAASGILGILSWILLFEIVPQKPSINFKGYYTQLFFVHIIFAIVAFMVYRLFI